MVAKFHFSAVLYQSWHKEGGVACHLHSNTDLSTAFPITPRSIPSLTPMWHHPLMSSFLFLVHQDEPEIITHQTLSSNRCSLAHWLCTFFFLLIKDSELLLKWNNHLAIEFQCNFIMQQIKFAFWMWLSHLRCVLLLIWADFFFGGDFSDKFCYLSPSLHGIFLFAKTECSGQVD